MDDRAGTGSSGEGRVRGNRDSPRCSSSGRRSGGGPGPADASRDRGGSRPMVRRSILAPGTPWHGALTVIPDRISRGRLELFPGWTAEIPTDRRSLPNSSGVPFPTRYLTGTDDQAPSLPVLVRTRSFVKQDGMVNAGFASLLDPATPGSPEVHQSNCLSPTE